MAHAHTIDGVTHRFPDLKTLFARGYDFVTITADIWLLADGAKRALEEAKPGR